MTSGFFHTTLHLAGGLLAQTTNPTELHDQGIQHIIERLHRADLGHLEIEFTIEDPLTYSKPWVIKRVADLDTTDEIGEYVCIDRDAPHLVGK